jgi:hypothetical protein
MHVGHAFTDLAHEEDTVFFSQRKIIGDHTFEQLPTRDTKT